MYDEEREKHLSHVEVAKSSQVKFGRRNTLKGQAKDKNVDEDLEFDSSR